MQLHTLIYDFKEQPNLGVFMSSLPLLLFSLFGLFVFYKNKKDLSQNIKNSKIGMAIGLFLSVFFGIFFTVYFTGNLAYYFEFVKIYDNKKYKIVEGRVSNYHPMQKGGHGDRESFNVNGIDFKFSDFDYTFGYNNATSKGGAIKENLFVRIYYFNNSDEDGNVILRLEVE